MLSPLRLKKDNRSRLNTVCLLIALSSISLMLQSCVSFMDDSLLIARDDKPSSEVKHVVIRGAELFDGEYFKGRQDVWFEGSIIRAVGRDLSVPQGASIIDAQGMTLIPGLIDMHTHLLMAGSPPWRPTLGDPGRTLSTNLASGITTLIDMGAPLGEIEDWENDTGVILPTYAYAGKMFNVEGGHPAYMIDKSASWPLSSIMKRLLIHKVDAVDDAKAGIDEHKLRGAKFIKLAIDEIPIGSPTMDDKVLKPLVEYAQSQGLKVVVHIGSEFELMRAVRAGVDLFVHGPYRSGFSERSAEILAKSNIPVVPTTVVFDQIAAFYEDSWNLGKGELAMMDPEIRDAYLNRPDDLELDAAVIDWFEQILRFRQEKFKTVSKMFDHGVPLFLGSDSPNVATVSGAALHQEMRLWDQHTQLSNEAILAAATGHPGDWLAAHLGWRVGRIEPGYDADIVLIDSDLKSSLKNTENISAIWIDGMKVKSLAFPD